MDKPSNASKSGVNWSDFQVSAREIEAPEWATGGPPRIEISVTRWRGDSSRTVKSLGLYFHVPAHAVPALIAALVETAAAALRAGRKRPQA
jgi:hypothetical protein